MLLIKACQTIPLFEVPLKDTDLFRTVPAMKLKHFDIQGIFSYKEKISMNECGRDLRCYKIKKSVYLEKT